MSWALQRRVVAAGDSCQVSGSATRAAVSVTAIHDCVHRVIRVALRAMRLEAVMPDVASFGDRIPIVVALASGEQMVRPHAWPDIAMMEDAKTIRDGTKVKFPRKAMGRYRTAIGAREYAVAATGAFIPEPAGRSLGYALPEAIYLGPFLRCHELGVV